MEISAIDLPSAATCFAIFFGVSFTILLAIVCAGIPSVYRSVAKHVRQIVARRRRFRRMLADCSSLQERADAIEGIVIHMDDDTGADAGSFDGGGDLDDAA
ncbi:hypothetical protein N9406_01625 [Verrucomicrobiales bacterium]|jgi:hypothetical protein|nr:hypothetical protein [Verrucomicrobiales bacterium]MDA9921810.1 hypothetical protein [Verrucomicrobiales bacterium]MDB2495911.1 hypothetical protein [Verrucomicrobiales bacterium]MDB3939633.1 hypothetical protein [Verrucomicrobiales bacterium]